MAAEPTNSYGFASMAGPRRIMSPNFSHALSSFYAHPTAPFSVPAYSFGNVLTTPSLSQQPQQQQQFYPDQYRDRLSSHSSTASSSSCTLPEIRPAKNALCQVHDEGKPFGGGGGDEAEFSTEVDVLMKAIQCKDTTAAEPSLPSLQQIAQDNSFVYPVSQQQQQQQLSASSCYAQEGQTTVSGKRRKYTCTLPRCAKSFAQKTHLDIHMRAHTGDKPFVSFCPSCTYIYMYIYAYASFADLI